MGDYFNDSITFNWGCDMNKENLVEAYIDTLVDNMDWDTMRTFVAERLWDEYNDYSEQQIVNEVREYYPHLLEEVTA